MKWHELCTLCSLFTKSLFLDHHGQPRSRMMGLNQNRQVEGGTKRSLSMLVPLAPVIRDGLKMPLIARTMDNFHERRKGAQSAFH